MVAAAIGAVGIGTSLIGADQASSQMSKSQDQQMILGEQQLGFAKQQYNDWQNVYGPIRKNLSDYYQHLDPQTLIASGLKNYEQQHNAAIKQIETNAAQRGVDTPATTQMLADASLTAARDKAAIRTSAPMIAAEAKQGFIDHNVVNPASPGVTGAMGNLESMYGNNAALYGKMAAGGYASAGAGFDSILHNYYQQQTYQSMAKSFGGGSDYVQPSSPWAPPLSAPTPTSGLRT